MQPYGCIIHSMNLIFKALADKTRRQLLDRLHQEQGQSLGKLCDGVNMRRQSVTRHLNLLEQAELVSVQWQGREKLYYLNPIPIAQINERWIDKFSQQKSHALARLKAALEDKPGDLP